MSQPPLSPRGLSNAPVKGHSFFSTLPHHFQSSYAWLMAPTAVPAAWKSGTVGAGAPCVMTDGTFGMLQWPAGNWAVVGRWLPLAVPSLGRVQGLCGSVSWPAGAARGSWASAPTGAGRPTSALTKRMQVSSVQVRNPHPSQFGGSPSDDYLGTPSPWFPYI
jgi:hypothetical protein